MIEEGCEKWGFHLRRTRTLASFRRSYNLTADEMPSPGGFYPRLTLLFAGKLRNLVERGLNEVAIPDAIDVNLY